MTRAILLDDAKKIICDGRDKEYGSPEDSFKKIAEYWNVYLGDILSAPIEASDVGIMMSLFKIARINTGIYKEDSFVDLIGYAACAGEIFGKEAK